MIIVVVAFFFFIYIFNIFFFVELCVSVCVLVYSSYRASMSTFLQLLLGSVTIIVKESHNSGERAETDKNMRTTAEN